MSCLQSHARTQTPVPCCALLCCALLCCVLSIASPRPMMINNEIWNYRLIFLMTQTCPLLRPLVVHGAVVHVYTGECSCVTWRDVTWRDVSWCVCCFRARTRRSACSAVTDLWLLGLTPACVCVYVVCAIFRCSAVVSARCASLTCCFKFWQRKWACLRVVRLQRCVSCP